MENKKSIIHRGEVLHRAAIRHKKSITKIAKDAGFDQSTFYFHKSKENLDLDYLLKYSAAMDNYDFSREIPEMADYMKKLGYTKDRKLSYEELEADRDLWKDKYYELLEENNRLLRERFKEE